MVAVWMGGLVFDFHWIRPLFENQVVFSNLASSLILLIVIVTLRIVTVRGLSKRQFHGLDIKRRWIVQVKNVALILILLGLAIIWGSELKTFAVSMVAIAAALAITMKEVFLCIIGGIVRAGTNAFNIGDRIEVNQIRGDVIDHNLFTTTLYEVGPGPDLHQFTGRTVVVPNALFLTQPIINETETGAFVLHVFRVPWTRESDWKEARKKLLNSCTVICDEFINEAQSQFDRQGRTRSLEMPNCNPRITLNYPDEKRLDFIVRIPAPSRRKGRVEQAILEHFEGVSQAEKA